jgi:hypothetical protein
MRNVPAWFPDAGHAFMLLDPTEPGVNRLRVAHLRLTSPIPQLTTCQVLALIRRGGRPPRQGWTGRKSLNPWYGKPPLLLSKADHRMQIDQRVSGELGVCQRSPHTTSRHPIT